MKIDVNRCRAAMELLDVEGIPAKGMRNELIEEAIRRIQMDGTVALQSQYMGIKNYAHFGDQREDHDYGYGPRHGSIVFAIQRKGDRKAELGPDHIYLLECVRDFGSVADPYYDREKYGYRSDNPPHINLCRVIEKADAACEKLEHYQAAIDAVEVGGYQSVPA